MENERFRKIKYAVLRKPYLFYFISIFIAYILINTLINQTYETFSIISGFSKMFIIPFLLFNFLVVPLLVALTINLSIIRFKELKSMNNAASSSTFLGVFGGVLGGACPGCFVGLFPAILGLFGISATLSVLPLYGLEIQIISSVLLITAVMFLTNEITCKISYDNKISK